MLKSNRKPANTKSREKGAFLVARVCPVGADSLRPRPRPPLAAPRPPPLRPLWVGILLLPEKSAWRPELPDHALRRPQAGVIRSFPTQKRSSPRRKLQGDCGQFLGLAIR